MNDEENSPKLESALRAIARDPIFVPPAKDEEIRAAIQQYFETCHSDRAPRTSARKQKFWHKWMPLAASLVIAAIMLYFARPTPDRADINGDGRVDVIDALLLAEQVRTGKGRDIDGNDAVTDADAAEIATRAVALERSRS
jgi:hypothetical protein